MSWFALARLTETESSGAIQANFQPQITILNTVSRLPETLMWSSCSVRLLLVQMSCRHWDMPIARHAHDLLSSHELVEQGRNADTKAGDLTVFLEAMKKRSQIGTSQKAALTAATLLANEIGLATPGMFEDAPYRNLLNVAQKIAQQFPAPSERGMQALTDFLERHDYVRASEAQIIARMDEGEPDIDFLKERAEIRAAQFDQYLLRRSIDPHSSADPPEFGSDRYVELLDAANSWATAWGVGSSLNRGPSAEQNRKGSAHQEVTSVPSMLL